MVNWVDTIVVIIVAGAGIFFLYKGLKEPLDAFFGFIKTMISWVFDKAKGKQEEAYDIITYGGIPSTQ